MSTDDKRWRPLEDAQHSRNLLAAFGQRHALRQLGKARKCINGACAELQRDGFSFTAALEDMRDAYTTLRDLLDEASDGEETDDGECQ